MDFFREYKRFIFGIITLLLVVVIIFTGIYKKKSTFIEDTLGFIVIPVQKTINNFNGWVDDKVSSFKSVSDLKKQNEVLMARVEELEEENTLLKLYKENNDKLSQLLQMKDKYSYFSTIGAEVVAKDVGNWYEVFTIDKGKDSDMSSDMVVIAQSGLVGRVTEVGANYSKVMSIIDDRSSVSVKTLRTGDLGIVKGDSTLRKDGMCRMEFIDINSDIIVGDEIITSHLGEIYPSGITVGFVKEIGIDSNGLTKYALIEPIVDFKHIEAVLIVNGKETYEQ